MYLKNVLPSKESAVVYFPIFSKGNERLRDIFEKFQRIRVKYMCTWKKFDKRQKYFAKAFLIESMEDS